ncbi:MAG TPA: phosphomethylpyrimidine synthase ThiC [Polyangia bacterium]|jgi:phosphomethylpyrimidine synthase|nr:phosphomethylpyrimidine synthase ThiC [Polyangia bacterium]
MATQLSLARQGTITDAMRMVAEDEGLDPEFVRQGVARGTIVIPKNIHHDFRPIGIGTGLRTKINANIGASGFHNLVHEELEKLHAAIRFGSDSVMDLSTGADLDQIRVELIKRCPVMLGTVPIYQAASEGSILRMDPEELFAVIEKQAQQGVDFMTVHCGVTRESVRHLREDQRLVGIVSRGGALLAAWIQKTGRENPLYEQFDRLCDIFFKYDVTFSLGDGLRPGGNHDAHDRGQIAELLVLGELVQRARERGCQVMVEGPGHVRIDEIQATVKLQKSICEGAPFYVLGPLSTDVAPGYDHITGAIGGAIAAGAGTDMLCYVTPAEHLRLPDKQDVIDGVIATRIAAHSGDLIKGVKGAQAWDDMMSRYRKALDWEGMFMLALDPDKSRRYKETSEAADSRVCTMCGSLCSINIDNHTHAPPKPLQISRPKIAQQ